MASSLQRKSPSEWHPLVKMTQECLENTEPNENGVIYPIIAKRLNVSVSKDLIQRSLAVMNRLLESVEGSGYSLRIASGPPCLTIVTIADNDFCICLREKISRREHIVTPYDKLAMQRYKHLHGVPEWDYVPSGKLIFTIDYLNIHQQLVNEVKWIDGEKKRIEDRMESIGDVLAKVANDVKMKKEWADEAMLKWSEEQDRRNESNRIQAEQRKRINELVEQVSTWEQAHSIRLFTQAVQEEALRRHGKVEHGSPLDRWILSNKHHAETLDPIPALLAEMSPLENCG